MNPDEETNGAETCLSYANVCLIMTSSDSGPQRPLTRGERQGGITREGSDPPWLSSGTATDWRHMVAKVAKALGQQQRLFLVQSVAARRPRDSQQRPKGWLLSTTCPLTVPFEQRLPSTGLTFVSFHRNVLMAFCFSRRPAQSAD